MSESESIRWSSFEFHSQKLFALSLPSCFINYKSIVRNDLFMPYQIHQFTLCEGKSTFVAQLKTNTVLL